MNYASFRRKCVTDSLKGNLPFNKFIETNSMKNAGIFILIIGVVLTIFTAVTFFTREKVVDLGSIAITADKPHHVYWSPWIGVGVMVLGVVIILVSAKK